MDSQSASPYKMRKYSPLELGIRTPTLFICMPPQHKTCVAIFRVFLGKLHSNPYIHVCLMAWCNCDPMNASGPIPSEVPSVAGNSQADDTLPSFVGSGDALPGCPPPPRPVPLPEAPPPSPRPHLPKGPAATPSWGGG